MKHSLEVVHGSYSFWSFLFPTKITAKVFCFDIPNHTTANEKTGLQLVSYFIHYTEIWGQEIS